MGKRYRVTDIPAALADASDFEREILLASTGAAQAVRAAGGTLTVQLEGRFGPRRGVVWRFHWVVSNKSRRLENAHVATWDSRERVLTEPGELPRYCRTPGEALAAGITALQRCAARGRTALHAPSQNRPRTAGCRTLPTRSYGLAHMVNRKAILDDRN